MEKKNFAKLILFVLFLSAFITWLAVFSVKPKTFRIIACDVGQGDAILAIYGSVEILTDGGNPNGKVIECLGRYMPFWDRTVEVVVNTHPQLDHYGGLIDVLKKYKVNYFVGNALDSSSQEYGLLKSEVQSGGVHVITPLKGTTIRYGLMHYDIFWPTEKFLTSEGWDGAIGNLGTFNSKRDPNDFSVQADLAFGKFHALMTGDIGENVSDLVIPNLPNISFNYIKIPHHGSKYGLTPDFLEHFKPEIAAISVGAKNRYGHPAPEIIKLLDDKGIKMLRTDLDGDIIVESNGEKFWIVK